MTEYWGGTIHFFLLTLYNLKNIGGGGGHVPPCPPPLPYSAVPDRVKYIFDTQALPSFSANYTIVLRLVKLQSV